MERGSRGSTRAPETVTPSMPPRPLPSTPPPVPRGTQGSPVGHVQARNSARIPKDAAPRAQEGAASLMPPDLDTSPAWRDDSPFGQTTEVSALGRGRGREMRGESFQGMLKGGSRIDDAGDSARRGMRMSSEGVRHEGCLTRLMARRRDPGRSRCSAIGRNVMEGREGERLQSNEWGQFGGTTNYFA